MVPVAMPAADMRKPTITQFARLNRHRIIWFLWRCRQPICENGPSRSLVGCIATGSSGFRGDASSRYVKTDHHAVCPAASPPDHLVSVAIPAADMRKPTISKFARLRRHRIIWSPWRCQQPICENRPSRSSAGCIATGSDDSLGQSLLSTLEL